MTHRKKYKNAIGGVPGERIETVTYRLPATIRLLVNIESAKREIGKSALVELALRRLFKVSGRKVA
jgi:hypothetical protein